MAQTHLQNPAAASDALLIFSGSKAGLDIYFFRTSFITLGGMLSLNNKKMLCSSAAEKRYRECHLMLNNHTIRRETMANYFENVITDDEIPFVITLLKMKEESYLDNNPYICYDHK